jgi:sugar lactone lactonase YvrE
VNRVDIESGKRTQVAQLKSSLDNLAIDSKDRVYVSNMADNGIQEVNVNTGKARQIVVGALSNPRALAVVSHGNKDEILVADNFAYRSVDGSSGKVTDLGRVFASNTKIAYPGAVSANDRHVFLMNSSGVINKYDARSGQLIGELKGPRAVGGVVELRDGGLLALQRTGVLVAIDAETGAVQKQVLEGLDRPYGIVKGSNEVMYITEPQAGRVVRFDPASGEKSVVCSNLKSPQAIALTATGELLVIETGSKRLVSIAPATGAVTEVAGNLPIGALGPALPPLSVGLAIGATGSIYITSDIENSIYKLVKR